MLNQIINEGLNVSASERLIDAHINKGVTDEKKAKTGYKSVSAFYTAINRAIESIKSTGIAIKSRRVEGDEFTELTIFIPKEA